jgi:hypothetical protein
LADILPDKNPFHHLEANELVAKALVQGNEGELLVYVPDSVEITRIDGLDVVDDLPDNENNEASNFTPLVVKIIFTLDNPQYGLYFVIPDDLSTNVFFTYNH